MYSPFLYQTECLDAVEDVRRHGLNRALIVMASGLGKTVTMAFIAKLLRQHKEGRVLFLCNNNNLLYQAKTTFQAINGTNHSYGYYHGEQKSLHEVDFLFASFQTMDISRDIFSPAEFAYVIVDESHHAQADTFRATLDYFKADFLLGATATPDRLDMRDIREIFGQEIYSLPLEEAMARGLVTPIDYRLLTDEIVRSEVLELAESRYVSLAELNRKIFIPRRDEEIARIVMKHASEFAEPRVMIFCSSIKHCEHLAQFMPESFAIHSRIPEKERGVRLEMFRQGIIRNVLTVNAFNEGIDVPEANVVVFLRSTTSRNIFLQQLGRGLRLSEGKNKVIALDFVANCERIKMVHALWRKIQEMDGKREQQGGESAASDPSMTLNIDSVEFVEKIIPVLQLLDRVCPNFYPTWQEASIVVQQFGTKNRREYKLLCKKDSRLPTHPEEYYSDFPGYPTFVGGERKNFYPTWQEAGEAVVALGVTTSLEYPLQYKQDKRLPQQPSQYYSDFPGWKVFLGTKHYPTWKKASKALIVLGIRSIKEYRQRYNEDPRLPSAPRQSYSDFPGWSIFLGRKKKNLYPTWEEASRAAKRLGIKNQRDYGLLRKKDSRLPASPYDCYANFPGLAKFLGKE